ncbi:hypothetical protein HGRIS_013980 [Hohenbuehelia grisea]|uniref:Uncharacterized protein n=1 Tax=Hohenbuehelia grisea TaxID=104357 RepID=A0ABR3JSM5_9AGAR
MPPAASYPNATYNILSELASVQETLLNEKLQVSLAFSYSWTYNRRRLEGHTYPIWDQIFAAFAALDASLVHAPQFPIYTLSPKGFDPDNSFRTIADGDAEEGLPDCALLCIRYRLRQGADIPKYRALLRGRLSVQLGSLPWAELARWDELVIEYAGIPIFAELKKFPSRTSNNRQRLLVDLSNLLDRAMAQLENYAEILFADPLRRDQDSVVLIAGAGEWYRWRVMKRSETGIPKPEKQPPVDIMDDEDEEEEEDENGSDAEESVLGDKFLPAEPNNRKNKKTRRRKRNEPTKKQLKALEKTEKEKEADETRVKHWKAQRDAGGDQPTPLRHLDQGLDAETVLDDMNNVVPAAGLWSGLLFLGSPASNQRMWYLRNHLASIVAARNTIFTKG